MATPSQALEKLKHFCSYQDRCHYEVENKLRQLGVWGNDAAEIIAMLITEDYLNEERFARSFARGKFRLKSWGKRKITQALQTKRISDYCIRKGLTEIDMAAYKQTLKKLAIQKYNSLKNEQYLRRQYKTKQFLFSKGYESNLIDEILNQVI